MTYKGCLFDFSGTTFRAEPAQNWLRAALAAEAIAVPDDEVAHWAGRLEAAGALPGGEAPSAVPERLARVWAERDLDAARHRAAFTGVAREVELPWPQLYDVLYDRHMSPSAWQPYPDTAGVLTALRGRGVPVGLLSNIGWDLRPVLREHGVDGLVDTEVLSFEENVKKPDPRIFRIACERLGLAPQEVLMVGDNPELDGGARALGCGFLHVEPLPVDRRPEGLLPVLDLAG